MCDPSTLVLHSSIYHPLTVTAHHGWKEPQKRKLLQIKTSGLKTQIYFLYLQDPDWLKRKHEADKNNMKSAIIKFSSTECYSVWPLISSCQITDSAVSLSLPVLE